MLINSMLLSFVPICDLFATLSDVALIHFLLLQFFLGIVPVKALELYLDLRRAIEDHVRVCKYSLLIIISNFMLL